MVSLGTPLSPHATTVLLLGSGELGKEVVIELQRLGVETVAVDRYADAPAMQVAHRSHVIDMQDAEVLRALLLKERPDLVVPELEAIATSVLARAGTGRIPRHPDGAGGRTDHEPGGHPPVGSRRAQTPDVALRIRRHD